MEQLRTVSQSKKLWALLKRANLAHYREELALGFSEGRTSSTKLLYQEECEEMIAYLQKQLPREDSKKVERPKPSKLWRKFFALCYKLGWEKGGKLDYPRIDAWCVQYGHCHKPVKQIEESELPKLIIQLMKIHDNKDAQGISDGTDSLD